MVGHSFKKLPLHSFFGLCISVVLYLLYLENSTRRGRNPAAERFCEDVGDDLETDYLPEIPDYMFSYLDTLVEQDSFKLPQCSSEQRNFVYVKTHKCASDTLAAVWRRFALTRNLSIVTPILGKFLLGWPHTFQYFMHRPSKHEGGYNVLLDHVVFNATYISSIMPADTVYFTSVREPFGRLGSALEYHGMKKCGRMPDVEIVQEFLDNMIMYDDLYRSPDNTMNLTGCKCIPKGLSIARNAMAFDLGFPNGWSMFTTDQQDNYTYISEWLQDLQQTVNVFVLVERFNESLILLKRSMCWSFKDILFRRLRSSKRPKNVTYSQEQIDAFRKWSNVDTLLYYMASTVFNKRVQSLGSDFQDEVAEFVRQETEVLEYCEFNTRPGISLDVNATRWDAGYRFSHTDCLMLMDKHHLRDLVKEEYDLLHGDYSDFPLKEGYNLATYC